MIYKAGILLPGQRDDLKSKLERDKEKNAYIKNPNSPCVTGGSQGLFV